MQGAFSSSNTDFKYEDLLTIKGKLWQEMMKLTYPIHQSTVEFVISQKIHQDTELSEFIIAI